MSDQTTLDFSSVKAIFTSEDFKIHAAEIHGVLTGLISAGYLYEDADYLIVLNDMINNGEGFPTSVK